MRAASAATEGRLRIQVSGVGSGLVSSVLLYLLTRLSHYFSPGGGGGGGGRFSSLNGSDNPGVSYKRVKCGFHPSLYEKSGCLLESDVV